MPKFEDIRPSQKASFLSEARERHPGVHPIGLADRPNEFHSSPGWGCIDCGHEFRLEDVVVDSGGPVCPICEAAGWDSVVPLGSPTRSR
jgi:hypothetical protein